MSFGELDSPSLADAEAVVTDNVSGDVDQDCHEHGKQRLLAALCGRSPSGAPVSRRAVLVGALLGVGAAGGAYAWSRRDGAPLSYVMTGGLLSDNGYLRGNGQSGSHLSFSDGSRVDVQQGARARIAAVDGHGAQIVIESGQIALNAVHRPTALWYVNAGPFMLRLTEAQVDVYWSNYDEILSVTAYGGNVLVSGPLVPSGELLPAGHRLTGYDGRITIERLDPVVEATERVEPVLEATETHGSSVGVPQPQPSESASPATAGRAPRGGP